MNTPALPPEAGLPGSCGLDARGADRRALGQAAMACAGGWLLPPAPAHAAPRRGIGVNCFDLFYGRLFSPGVKPPAQRLRPLADMGIPFVRFAASPVWPVEWQRFYRDKRQRYFDLLDETVRAAEDLGMQLVPTLFWYPAAVSDLVGESVPAWAVAGSKSQAFMRQYVAEVVPRYGRSPSILAWEFANEFNAYANLPNATRWWPRVSVDMGTPAQRTQADLITSLACSQAFAAFAAEVRRHSPAASVSSGADLPLFNSENLLLGRADPDSEVQFQAALQRLAPDGCDFLSIHLYADKVEKFRINGRKARVADLIQSFSKVCREAGKRSFVGEFGVENPTTAAGVEQQFENMLQDIVLARVDLAALWVYDFAQQEGQWSVTPSNRLAWMLKAVQSANLAMK